MGPVPFCPHSILCWDLRASWATELKPKPSSALTSSRTGAVSHCGPRELALLRCLSHQTVLQVAVGDAGNALLCCVGSQACEETVLWGLQQHCLCRSSAQCLLGGHFWGRGSTCGALKLLLPPGGILV